MKRYKVPVNFTTTYQVVVEARNEEEAKELAKSKATDLFIDDLYYDYLWLSDFVCNPQEPM